MTVNNEDNNDVFDQVDKAINDKINDVDLSSVMDSEDGEDIPVKKKGKGKIWLIVILILLVLAIAAAAAWYFMQRQKPVSTVKEYLSDVKDMNFDGMKSLLQSNDLSALDDASITDDAYNAFFQSINQKMSYKITKTDFNLTNGTANITARITYIDATNIYKEAMTDFVKQIVSSTFAGQTMTDEEMSSQLAALLAEKAQTTEDNFAEEDITYPLIEAGGKWKVVALDSDTVRVMSGNFTNVQDEINASLEDAGTSDSSDTTAPSAQEGDVIDMTNDSFTIHYTKATVGEDWAGDPCVMVYYDYTNNSSSASSAMVDVTLRAYQNGTTLQAGIPAADDEAYDNYTAEVAPGQTVNICQVFDLADTTTDVTLEASQYLAGDNSNVSTQILKVQ